MKKSKIGEIWINDLKESWMVINESVEDGALICDLLCIDGARRKEKYFKYPYTEFQNRQEWRKWIPNLLSPSFYEEAI